MTKKVKKLVYGLLATSLMGCGVSSEVTAHPPAAFSAEPTAVSGPPAQVRPARPVGSLATATTTARRPAAPLAAKPATTSTELTIGAPNRRIQAGRIIDEAGQPLVGATVLLKGTTRGTSTDANGDYSLPVPLGLNTFVVAYAGYQEEEAQSRDGQPLTVTLLPVLGLAPAEPAAPEPKSKARQPKVPRHKLRD
jgi:hypothetical protein